MVLLICIVAENSADNDSDWRREKQDSRSTNGQPWHSLGNSWAVPANVKFHFWTWGTFASMAFQAWLWDFRTGISVLTLFYCYKLWISLRPYGPFSLCDNIFTLSSWYIYMLNIPTLIFLITTLLLSLSFVSLLMLLHHIDYRKLQNLWWI